MQGDVRGACGIVGVCAAATSVWVWDGDAGARRQKVRRDSGLSAHDPEGCEPVPLCDSVRLQQHRQGQSAWARRRVEGRSREFLTVVHSETPFLSQCENANSNNNIIEMALFKRKLHGALQNPQIIKTAKKNIGKNISK